MFNGSGSGLGQGISQFFAGMFGDSGAPYQEFADQFQKYIGQAKDIQNPFYQAGTGAIPQYQNWLSQMQNPSDFINKMMGQYQESPYAKFQQKQGQRAINNAASASGMLGSTPFMQESANYAQDISSKDMNQWLQNVLGINTQYGQGQQNLMTGGQTSANSITELLSKLAQGMGEASYGKKAGEQTDMGNMFGGIGSILSGLLGMF